MLNSYTEFEEFLAFREAVRTRAHKLADISQWDTLQRYRADFNAHAHCITQQHLACAHAQIHALKAFGVVCLPRWLLPHDFLKIRHPGVWALFARGDLNALYKPGIAIVGSRQASPEATQWAYALAKSSTKLGWNTLSGGALGVDRAAHTGALDAQGSTLAFLGVSCDRIYPHSNADLFRRILRNNGLLLSEYAPGEITYKGGHALRNRLIAAFARKLVIVEADVHSGTLVTAQEAYRYRTPIFVSPSHVLGKRTGIETLLTQKKASFFNTLQLMYGRLLCRTLDPQTRSLFKNE